MLQTLALALQVYVSLCLLSIEHRQPKDVVRSLLPSWNNFVWFEVTEASHHQVSGMDVTVLLLVFNLIFF